MLTPSDVAERTFHTKRFNGYSTEEVDLFMDRLTEDYTNLYKENAVLKSKMKVLVDKISQYRATEDDMRALQLRAREQADEKIASAEKERAARLAAADDEVAERRAELRKEIADAEAQLEAAKLSTQTFVTGMRALVQQQFDFLERLPDIEAQEEDEPADQVSETAAAIDDSLSTMIGEDIAESLRAAEAAAQAAPEAAYAQEVPDLNNNEPTRVIDLGDNAADQDYSM